MSKVSEMKLEDIFKKLDIKFRIDDINKFCTDPKVIREIAKVIEDGESFDNLMLENEDKIDKEKLLFVSWIRYTESIKKIENSLKENKSSIIMVQSLEKKLKENRASKLKLKKVCKGMDTYLVTPVKTKEKINNIEVRSSKEEITGFDYSSKEKENKKIFEHFDKVLSAENEEDIGMDYVLQCVEVEDLYSVMPKDIATGILYKVEKNIQKSYKKEIERLKEKIEDHEDDDDEARKLNNYIREYGIIPEIRESVENALKYTDLQKLLLISVYRFEQIVETDYLNKTPTSPSEVVSIYEIVQQVMPYIGKRTNVNNENIKYNYQDVNAFMRRINEKTGEYIGKQEIDCLKEELLNGGNLAKMSSDELEKLNMLQLTEEEIECIMKASKENFAFGLIALNPSKDKILEYAKKSNGNWSDDLTAYLFENERISRNSILELYYGNIVSSEFFKEFSEETNISSEINLQKINKLHGKIKNSKEANEVDKVKLEKQIELYKKLNLEGKSKEELEEESNNVMYEIAEDFNDQADIIFYYENGLLTLDTVVEWGGDLLISNLYNESKITLQDIEELYNKGQIKQKTIEKVILSIKDLDEAELMAYVYLGYISDENIVKIFEEKNLHSTYATDLYEAGVISKDAEEKIKSRDIKKLEKRSGSPIRNLNELDDELEVVEGMEISFTTNKTKSEIRNTSNKNEDTISKDTTYHVGKGHNTKIINPFIRYEYLKALKCRKPERLKIDEDSPFYNYDFYVIQEECYGSELQRDAVVIAERFYEDKYNKEEFATMNATYVMNYEDYLVLQGKQKEAPSTQKREMIKEIDGAVYVVNHRSGSWASSMLYKIAQAKAGMSFRNYTGSEKRKQVIDWLRTLYTEEELDEILDLGIEIDNEDYTYEERNGQLEQSNKLVEDEEGR